MKNLEQENVIQRLPESIKNVFRKAYSGSKANAIKAKCLDCTCNHREEIKNCEAFTCPLWNVRPYRTKKN